MAGGTKRYTVQSPVVHDGKRYEIGETIELADPQAAPLVEIGVVIEVVGKKSNG